MTATKTITILCDAPGCDASGDDAWEFALNDGHTAMEVRHNLWPVGWRFRAGVDLCPEHSGHKGSPHGMTDV